MSGAGEIEGESGDGGGGVAAGAVLGGWGAECLEGLDHGAVIIFDEWGWRN